MLPVRSSVLVALGLTAALAAQQRLAATGVVLDASGRPLRGATVTFVGAVLPIVDAHGGVDRVQVQSDDGGRFAAPLLPHADYSAWAAVERGAVALASAVRHPVGGGHDLVLTVDGEPRLRELRPFDLAAWEADGPCTLAVAPVLPVVAPVPITLRDGAAKLPPFTGDWHLFVRDARGVLVHAVTLRPDRDGFAEPVVPAPRTVQVRAVDEQGEAIAGAELWLRMGANLARAAGAPSPASWHGVGTTANDGTLELELGVDGQDSFAFVARAEGRSVGATALGRPAGPALPASLQLPIVLPAGHGTTARWPANGRKVIGRVLPGIGVRALAGTSREWQLFVEPRGGWQADVAPHGVELAVAAMPAGTGTVPAIARFAYDAQQTLRFADLGTLRLHGTAASLRLLVQPALDQPLPANVPFVTLSLDLPATLRLGVGRWRLLACDGEGFAWHELDLLPGATDLRLEMQSLAMRTGRMFPVGGASPLGAVIRCAGRDGAELPLPVEVAPFEQPATPMALPVLPDDLALAMSTWLAARARLGADGTFAVAMLRCYAPRLPFVVSCGDHHAVLPAYVQRAGR